MRSAGGRADPMIASTATAKAMSVAVGIAQPTSRLRAAGVDGGVDQGGHEHATRGGGDRHHGPVETAQ